MGSFNPKSNLIVVENNSEIDLKPLDSVRENIKGFGFLRIIWTENI
ncbi:MAG: hypothetical protein ACJAXY_000685 [Nonlabens sp.]|jgi:hypothetical protein